MSWRYSKSRYKYKYIPGLTRIKKITTIPSVSLYIINTKYHSWETAVLQIFLSSSSCSRFSKVIQCIIRFNFLIIWKLSMQQKLKIDEIFYLWNYISQNEIYRAGSKFFCWLYNILSAVMVTQIAFFQIKYSDALENHINFWKNRYWHH